MDEVKLLVTESEEVLLGSEILLLPLLLLESKDIFRNIVSLDSWQTVISKEEKRKLEALLPQFSENDAEEKSETLRRLFGGENFKFGNPLEVFRRQLKLGLLNPSIIEGIQHCRQQQYSIYASCEKARLANVMQEIINNRQRIFDRACQSAPGSSVKVHRSHVRQERKSHLVRTLQHRARQRYHRILDELKEACGGQLEDSDSAEEETGSSGERRGSINATLLRDEDVSKVTGTFVQCHTTVSMDDCGLSNDEYWRLLKRHRNQRRQHESDSLLNFDDIQLNELIDKYTPQLRHSYLGIKKSQSVVGKDSGSGVDESGSVWPLTVDGVKLSLHNIGSRVISFLNDTPQLFHWLRDAILSHEPLGLTRSDIEEVLCTTSALHSDISAPLTNADWSTVALILLGFLQSGHIQGHERVIYLEGTRWHWVANVVTDLDLVHQTLVQSLSESGNKLFPKTEIVLPVANTFHQQELERFAKPHTPFRYYVDGQSYLVGPVRSVFVHQVASKSKVREHALLVTGRPPWVNILTLVHDAVARLPNGEGTRADICNLLLQSYYVCSDCDIQQLMSVVSGALDRLQYEDDPCVKFDISQKVWVYLHRNRTAEEFERAFKLNKSSVVAKLKKTQSPKPPKKYLRRLSAASSATAALASALADNKATAAGGGRTAKSLPKSNSMTTLALRTPASLVVDSDGQQLMSPPSTASSDSFVNVDGLSPASSPPLSGRDVNMGRGGADLGDLLPLVQRGNGKLERSWSVDEYLLMKRSLSVGNNTNDSASGAFPTTARGGKAKRGSETVRSLTKLLKRNRKAAVATDGDDGFSVPVSSSSSGAASGLAVVTPSSAKRRKKNSTTVSLASLAVSSTSLYTTAVPAITSLPISTSRVSAKSTATTFLSPTGVQPTPVLSGTSLLSPDIELQLGQLQSSAGTTSVSLGTGSVLTPLAAVVSGPKALTHASLNLGQHTNAAPGTMTAAARLQSLALPVNNILNSSLGTQRASSISGSSAQHTSAKRSRPKVVAASQPTVTPSAHLEPAPRPSAVTDQVAASRATVAALMTQLLRTGGLQQVQVRPQLASSVALTTTAQQQKPLDIASSLTSLQAGLIVAQLPGMQGPTALLVPQSGLRSFSASGGIQLLATLGPQQQQATVQTGRVSTAINNTRPVGTANILPAVSVAGSHFTANDFTLLLTPTSTPILTSSTPTNLNHPPPSAALNVKVKVPPVSLPPTTNASHVTSSMSQARSKFVSSLARSREVSIPLVTSSSAGTTGAVTSQLVAAVLGSARMPRPKTIPILKTAQPANAAFRPSASGQSIAVKPQQVASHVFQIPENIYGHTQSIRGSNVASLSASSPIASPSTHTPRLISQSVASKPVASTNAVAYLVQRGSGSGEVSGGGVGGGGQRGYALITTPDGSQVAGRLVLMTEGVGDTAVAMTALSHAGGDNKRPPLVTSAAGGRIVSPLRGMLEGLPPVVVTTTATGPSFSHR